VRDAQRLDQELMRHPQRDRVRRHLDQDRRTRRVGLDQLQHQQVVRRQERFLRSRQRAVAVRILLVIDLMRPSGLRLLDPAMP